MALRTSVSRSVAGAALAFAPLVGMGAESVQQLRPVIVTGSLAPRSLGSEFAATSVLTREDIERAGARDLVSALQLLGTAFVEQQGGTGTAAVIRLRGADSRDTLVLVDGVPLTDVTSGLASIAQIATDSIERIEVVRGNLSALYGANATGGVIQIFTRRADAGFDAQAAVGAGSRATRSGSASFGLGQAALRARATIGAERSDGFSAANPSIAPNANPDADGNRRQHASLALDASVGDGHDVGADLRWLSGRVEYDDPSAFGAPTDTHESHLVQRGVALRGRHRVAPAWTLAWRAAGNDEQRTDSALTAFGASSFGNTLHSRLGGIDVTAAPAAGLTVLLGAETLRQSTDNPTYTRRSRTTDTMRGGVSVDADWGGVQASVRHDRTSDFGNADTALVAGRWKADSKFNAFATLSSSFTPPTLDFLFFDCTAFGFVCSNPNLKPERVRSADVAAQWDDGSTLLRATLFEARYRDKIANDASGVPRNVARARNRGVELAARTTAAPWRLAAEATWQHPVDEATGQRLLRRAAEQVALRVGYDLSAGSIDAALRQVGARPDSGGVTLASYVIVDANARWRVAPGWELQATIENVLDQRYEPVAGYNGRPRGAFVALRGTPR